MTEDVDSKVQTKLQGIKGWRGINNPWMPEDDEDLSFSYINLLDNVERYTGYKVPSSFLLQPNASQMQIGVSIDWILKTQLC